MPDQSIADPSVQAALRDANHRLKNALHLAASLLNLQRGRLTDAAARDQFDAAIERIAVLGMVYGAVPPDDESVSARRLIEGVCRDFGALEHASVRVEADDAPLRLERAIPIAMVVHELVANALRHGVRDGGGRVSVRYAHAPGQGWRLEIADDGVGFDDAGATGFGLELVHIMVGQLQGTLARVPRTSTDAGTTWRIDFPDETLEI